MDILKHLKNHYDYAAKERCSEPRTGCTLDLRNLDEYLVLKGEEVLPGQPACDCIIFTEKGVLAAGAVELKSKTVDVSKVMQQLTNGVKFIFEALEGSGIDRQSPKVYVVVLAQKWRKHEYELIKKRRIEIFGKKYPILTKRCGTYFSEIISKF